MRRWVTLACIIVATVVVVSYSILAYVDHLDYLSKVEHETDRWAIIMDSEGDIIAVETTYDQIWNTLDNLHRNQTVMWVGGIVEGYDNKWGFRFKPDTIIIAQITIEGAQSNIRGISGDLDYWMNVWTKETYVLARVVEIHE